MRRRQNQNETTRFFSDRNLHFAFVSSLVAFKLTVAFLQTILSLIRNAYISRKCMHSANENTDVCFYISLTFFLLLFSVYFFLFFSRRKKNSRGKTALRTTAKIASDSRQPRGSVIGILNASRARHGRRQHFSWGSRIPPGIPYFSSHLLSPPTFLRKI